MLCPSHKLSPFFVDADTSTMLKKRGGRVSCSAMYWGSPALHRRAVPLSTGTAFHAHWKVMSMSPLPTTEFIQCKKCNAQNVQLV